MFFIYATVISVTNILLSPLDHAVLGLFGMVLISFLVGGFATLVVFAVSAHYGFFNSSPIIASSPNNKQNENATNCKVGKNHAFE